MSVRDKAISKIKREHKKKSDERSIDLNIPYLFTPHAYQRDNIFVPFEDGYKRIIAVWNRRAGKDKTCWNLMIREALDRAGNYYYIFPTYEAGKKALWDAIDFDGLPLRDHIPKGLITKTNETEMKVELKTKDNKRSTIQVIGAKEPDRLRGTNPRGVVFSEFAYFQNAEAWEIIRPVLAQNEGWAIFVSTPNGANHFHELVTRAKQDPKWYVSILTVDDTKSLTPEQLEQERMGMPADFFTQEYYCKFLEGASSVFKNIEQCLYDGDIKVSEYHKYNLGIDLAKVMDFTVITPVDLMEHKVGFPERFNKIDYNWQKSRIEAIYYKFKGASIRLDSTGVGEPIYDDLVHKGIKNISPYHFTETSRRNLLMNLLLLIEQGKIKLPRYEILLDELKSFQYKLTAFGKVRMEAPEGSHDDCVMSLALAVWELPQEPLKSMDKVREDREILRQFDFYRNKTKQRTGRHYW